MIDKAGRLRNIDADMALEATSLAISGDIQNIEYEGLALEATSLSISGDIQELRDIVEAIDIELDGLAQEATLTDMKGTGFDSLIHSLKEIKNRIG